MKNHQREKSRKDIVLKNKGLYVIIGILVFIAVYFGIGELIQNEEVAFGKEIKKQPDEWMKIIATSTNSAVITIDVDGKTYNSTDYNIYMSDDMQLMCPVKLISEMFGCACNIYNDSVLRIVRGNDIVQLSGREDTLVVNGDIGIDSARLVKTGGEYEVSVSGLARSLGYDYEWNAGINQGKLTNIDETDDILPARYSYIDENRAPMVKNQGSLGTCWAFASLTALESSLMPEEVFDFSEDHMTLCNPYNINTDVGGDYEMAVAYLTSWKGPVKEENDPYDDGKTDDTLGAVKHVQEVVMPHEKDYDTIKRIVLQHGGVQSSIYAANTTSKLIYSDYYNRKYNSYCYNEKKTPNHEIVIIGWDDNYPKENFNVEVEGNGAFICRNSWGEEFGEKGNFYISYYDANIGITNVAYTKVEDIDNYDNIYQSDLCGWVGQIGYGSDEAYFANVYTAKGNEHLEAVSFYATGKDTRYSIYYCDEFEGPDSLTRRGDPVISGKIDDKGYYTIPLDKTIYLREGQKYAIIVKITTPGSERPVAIEFKNDYLTADADITDGEGYVSLKGIEWENTESSHECNVCLKAFTQNVTK